MTSRFFAALAAGLALLGPHAAGAQTPRNIIVMVADGSGYNMLAATRYFLARPLTADGPEWARASMATYALRRNAEPLSVDQDPLLVYDSDKNWDARPLDGESACAPGYPAGFAGYEWMRCTYPDSANTASAMMTGVRTYNGAINVDGAGQPVLSAAEAAKAAGKRVGTISTVPFTHATPAAGGGAHNVSRGNYHAIADEMLGSGTLDFIAGGGNPLYDNDGRARPGDMTPEQSAEAFEWLSPAAWDSLRSGAAGWTLAEDAEQIAALQTEAASGPVIVLPRVGATLQAQRTPAEGSDPRQAPPYTDPLTKDLPDLADLTRAALSQLGGTRQGLFLAIEGGAVDWAMHANSLGRAIEEYAGFDEAVQLVSDWVDDPANGSSWDNTLVIVTADHDHLLFGPDAVSDPFQPIANRGAGQLPGHIWLSNSHSNQLVPFFVRGAGAQRFIEHADETDRTEMNGRPAGRGRYLTQTEMGAAILALLEEQQTPGAVR